MTDLHTRLAALGSATPPTDDHAVAADLRRGRRALARRRTVRVATTGAFALAVGGATAAVVSTHGSGGDGAPSGTRLVDYAGEQLPGFTVAEVPEGYVLQGTSAGVLDIARPGDHSVLDDFENKIVVTVESTTETASARPSGPHVKHRQGDRIVRDGARVWLVHNDGTRVRLPGRGVVDGGGTSVPPETVGSPIDVDGSAGTVSTNSEGAQYFRYVSSDRRVVIQVWPTINLSDAQLREFADGVTVTATAQLSHG